MYKLLFGLLVLAPMIWAGEIEVFPCENMPDVPIPIRYFVEGCDVAPCVVYNNTYSNIELTFEVPYDTTSLNTELVAILGPLEIPQELPEDLQDACSALDEGYSCPIAGGTVVSGRTAIFAQSPIDDLTVVLRFSISDSSGNYILCFEGDTIIAS